MGKSAKLIKNQFRSKNDIEVFEDQDLKRFSTMRLKSRGDLIIIKSEERLGELLKFLYSSNTKYLILGMGANQLLKESIDRPIIKLELPLDSRYFENVRDLYELPASITLSKLSSHAIQFGLVGWEVFTGIPATLGGAIFMNAGTNLGEICHLIDSVTYFKKDGKKIVKKTSAEDFSYRENLFLKEGDIITSARLKNLGRAEEISMKIKSYLKQRNDSQPLSEFTCGCIFKNNSKACRAGHYLDILGLKGFSSENFRISPKHGNFIENVNKGAYTEVDAFMNFIQKEMSLQYGVEFEFEVKR